MKHIFRTLIFMFVSLAGLSSCGIEGHNRAGLRPVDQNDERIYGDKNGPPRQLAQKYEDDKTGKTQARIDSIRTKFFPK